MHVFSPDVSLLQCNVSISSWEYAVNMFLQLFYSFLVLLVVYSSGFCVTVLILSVGCQLSEFDTQTWPGSSTCNARTVYCPWIKCSVWSLLSYLLLLFMPVNLALLSSLNSLFWLFGAFVLSCFRAAWLCVLWPALCMQLCGSDSRFYFILTLNVEMDSTSSFKAYASRLPNDLS